MIITDEARQMAADLANAEIDGIDAWKPYEFETGSACIAFARLCQQTLDRAKAEPDRDALLADMRRVDAIAVECQWAYCFGSGITEAATIAARYRVETDPLLIEARKLVSEQCLWDAPKEQYLSGKQDNHFAMRTVLAALKRGIEIGGGK